MKAKHYIIIALIIAGAFVANGFMSYNAKMKDLEENRLRLEEERRTELANQVRMEKMYDDCRESAYQMYQDDWNKSCELLKKEKDCALPSYYSNQHDEKREKDEENCVKLYK